jgi:hypothetical protein
MNKEIFKPITSRLASLLNRGTAFGLVTTIVNIFMLLLVYSQLREISNTNKVSIRAQLYQTDMELAGEDDKDLLLKSVWALTPGGIRGPKYADMRMQMLTNDRTALKAKNAAELYHSMYDIAVFTSPARLAATEGLRRTFSYLQNTLYHVGNAFDATDEGILERGEWDTWKGALRETHNHPLLLAVIWHGVQNRYFSREFAGFLQKELYLSMTTTGDKEDRAGLERDQEFVAYFYPEMTGKDWGKGLPEYGRGEMKAR